MREQVIELLQNYQQYAVFISIVINILISILGFIPSIFITAANLIVFDFWKGTFVSFIGEGLGAVISFIIYRKGLRKLSKADSFQLSWVRKLLEVEGKEAFIVVFSLRLLPLIPSGVVTFFGAMGKMSLLIFALSSTLGKLPALLIEAYSAENVIQWTWEGKVILTVLAGGLLVSVVRNLSKK